jgi:hypothetical protein
MKRVVITGAGTVNALGLTVPDTLGAMREGRCGIGPLSFRDVDRLSIQIGAQVHDFDEATHFNRQQLSLYDRFTQFTLIAAREAMAQAGLDFSGEIAAKSGVVLGNSGGGMTTLDDNYRSVYEEGKNRVHPFVVPKLMNNAAASHVSMEFNLKGPSFTVSTACASSNHAMAQAFQMVHGGLAGDDHRRVGIHALFWWRQGMGRAACHVARCLPPVFGQSQRHGTGRRRGRFRVRGLRARPQARGRDPRRSGGVRHDIGRGRHRHALQERRGAGHAWGLGGCPYRP